MTESNQNKSVKPVQSSKKLLKPIGASLSETPKPAPNLKPKEVQKQPIKTNTLKSETGKPTLIEVGTSKEKEQKAITKRVVQPIKTNKMEVEPKPKPASIVNKNPVNQNHPKGVNMKTTISTPNSITQVPIKKAASRKDTIAKQESKNLAKSQKNKKSILLLFLVVSVLLIGVFFVFNKSTNSNTGKQGESILNKILPMANVALVLPTVPTKGEGSPIWVHFVNTDDGSKALKLGPSAILNSNKEIKAVSPFFVYTPSPAKGGWQEKDVIVNIAKEVNTIMAENKCNTERLVVSGEGAGVTAAFLFAAQMDGRVGAILCLGTPQETVYEEIDKFRYAPIRMLVDAHDKDAVGWAQKIAGDLRSACCAVTVTEINVSAELEGGVWASPEIWSWMVTRRVANEDTRKGVNSLMIWSKPKLGPLLLSSKPVQIDVGKLIKGGLTGDYYEGIAFDKKILSRIDKQILINDLDYKLPDNRRENLSIRWSGYIHIEKEGMYTFFSSSDDGQRLYLGTFNIIDDWNGHGVLEMSNNLKLLAGWYPIKIEYFQGGGGGSFQLAWKGPNFEKKILEGDVLAILKAD